MGTTTTYSLPYPEGADPPAGHTQIQALAEAVDATVGGLLSSPLIEILGTSINLTKLQVEGGMVGRRPVDASTDTKLTMTFSTPFARVPLVIVSRTDNEGGQDPNGFVWATGISTSKVDVHLRASGPSPQILGAAWLAIGEKA